MNIKLQQQDTKLQISDIFLISGMAAGSHSGNRDSPIN
jgi:hypothetical protein